jgi:hypothetical protein
MAQFCKGLRPVFFYRLSAYDKKWIEELPIVLWAVRTTANRATSETPFFFVYRAEAVLPPKV